MTKNITFTLPSEALEGATEAILLGDFNNWNPDNAPKLQKQSNGSYKTVAQLEAGRTYHYRFLLNNGKWVNDYHAQSYEQVPGYYVDNCVITVPENSDQDKNENKMDKAPTNTKVVKADSSAEESSPVKKKTAKARAAKKPAADGAEKMQSSKPKKTKAANTKVVGDKADKTTKKVSKTKEK